MLTNWNGIQVVLDYLDRPYGTKTRYLGALFDEYKEVIYASPCEGGAQVAMAACAASCGGAATIVCAKRRDPHPRTLQALELGAEIIEVTPGYLNVVQFRARQLASERSVYLAPFGLSVPGSFGAIANAAWDYSLSAPDEVWCAAGSGTLSRGLQLAWPDSEHHVVQVGHALTSAEAGRARITYAGMPFARRSKYPIPFPMDRHYEAKAWEAMINDIEKYPRPRNHRVLFWCVLGES